MHKLLITIYIAGVFLSGCASSTVTPVPATAIPTSIPTATSSPEPECSAETIPDLAGYATWTKVNPNPIKGHETFVNIYVDDKAKDVYLSASGATLPICSMIVKTHLASADSETITAVTVMVKMPAGYDPEHNDWWWGMYDKDGKVAEMSGKVPVCIACHQPVASEDYVFSQKVIEESSK